MNYFHFRFNPFLPYYSSSNTRVAFPNFFFTTTLLILVLPQERSGYQDAKTCPNDVTRSHDESADDFIGRYVTSLRGLVEETGRGGALQHRLVRDSDIPRGLGSKGCSSLGTSLGTIIIRAAITEVSREIMTHTMSDFDPYLHK